MLGRWVSAIMITAVGIIPVAPDAFVFATTKPLKQIVIRHVPMTVAHRLKDDSQCHPSTRGATALLPSLVADVPFHECGAEIPPFGQTSVQRVHASISHAPAIPASHRIRAP